MKLQMLKFGCAASLAAIVLVLLIPAIGLWAFSYWRTDDVMFHQSQRFSRFKSSGGGVWLENRSPPLDPNPHIDWQRFDVARYPFARGENASIFERCGFLFSAQGSNFTLVVPYWFVVVGLTGLLFLCVVVICKLPTRGEDP
ncbi:hypothetical protein [Anatilimnocola floriformis]|uniref:hypothetical protein n=1 Tax=Anatilimnocola floriformis TaxID=2948575 RepID=UPI0020C32770|nr:hypothetical protein [Anatilimnocola floriformis]